MSTRIFVAAYDLEKWILGVFTMMKLWYMCTCLGVDLLYSNLSNFHGQIYREFSVNDQIIQENKKGSNFLKW